jgi:hypothetical protein
MDVESIVSELQSTPLEDRAEVLMEAVHEYLVEESEMRPEDVDAFDGQIGVIVGQALPRLLAEEDRGAAEAVIQDVIEEALCLFAGVEEQRQEMAEATGEDADRLWAHVMDFEKMRGRGILVDPDIYGVSLLRQRVTWAELGIPEGDVRRKRLHRGTKYLFPEFAKKFNSLDARLRRCVETHSFDLEGFRPYRFVPVTAYEDWREKWDELVEEWNALKSELLDEYDERMEEERKSAAEVADEAWDALMSRHKAKARANGGNGEDAAVIIRDKAFEDKTEFVEWVQDRATSRYPSRQALKDGLYPTYKTSMILAPSDLLVDEVREERLRTQIEEERAEQRALTAEARTKEEQERIERQRMREQARAMHEAEMERAREMVAQTVSPFQEAFEELRAQIHEDVLEIVASIKKNGYVRGRVAERARRLQETFALLNAHDDDDLAKALEELSGHLEKDPAVKARTGKTYDTEAVLSSLEEVEEMTHEAAQEVARRAQRPTSGIALDL